MHLFLMKLESGIRPNTNMIEQFSLHLLVEKDDNWPMSFTSLLTNIFKFDLSSFSQKTYIKFWSQNCQISWHHFDAVIYISCSYVNQINKSSSSYQLNQICRKLYHRKFLLSFTLNFLTLSSNISNIWLCETFHPIFRTSKTTKSNFSKFLKQSD